MLRWLFGAVVLLIVGAVFGLMTGDSRIQDMSANVQADLLAAGHDWVDVDMAGNVVTLSGTAPDQDARQSAVTTAQNAFCSACREKHRWHEVKDAIDVGTPVAQLPVQDIYTFSARKLSSGDVTISGYAPSEQSRSAILRNAQEVFGDAQMNADDITLASGAPDLAWSDAVNFYVSNLAQLDQGRVLLEGREGALQGTTSDPELQNRLFTEMQENAPEGFNLVGNIAVPGGSVMTFGQAQSQSICQALLDDLRRGRKIGFGPGEVTIRGDENFGLLGEFASAARQCPAFQISINGYTSSEGENNQALSEARANAVLTFLRDQGRVEASRLSAQGFGPSNPIASNDTAEGRNQNRRIEFIVSKVE